jgi:hypothetical protein
MKKNTILTIISLLITIYTNAGRYYHRSYHYYGTSDDSGKYLFLFILGLILLLGLIVLIVDTISHSIKESNISKYKTGAWTMPISPDGKYQMIQEIKSDKINEYGENLWIDNKLVKRNGIWAPVFYGVKFRITKEGKEVIFEKAKNLTVDYLTLSNEKVARFDRPIFGKKKITMLDKPNTEWKPDIYIKKKVEEIKKIIK